MYFTWDANRWVPSVACKNMAYFESTRRHLGERQEESKCAMPISVPLT
jgi:hypothetical protein